MKEKILECAREKAHVEGSRFSVYITDLEEIINAIPESEDVIELVKSIEYIDVSDYFELETEWRHCPECGYKEPDGHWQTCSIGLFLESQPEDE